MENYQHLLEWIKDLASYYDDDDDDDYQEKYYPIETRKTKDSLQMIILFNAAKNLDIYQDTFELKENSEVLFLHWQRISQNKISMIKSVLPKKIDIFWKFRHSDEQEYIFNKIIKDINLKFDEYNYRDSVYHSAQIYNKQSNDNEDLNNDNESSINLDDLNYCHKLDLDDLTPK